MYHKQCKRGVVITVLTITSCASLLANVKNNADKSPHNVSSKTSIAQVPLSDAPITLRNEDGSPEAKLIDPFSSDGSSTTKSGFTDTTLNQLPEDIVVKAIVIPEDTGSESYAIIEFMNENRTVIVKENDRVRITNEKVNAGQPQSRRKRQPSAGGLEQFEIAKQYDFYIQIGKILPDHIEISQQKNPNVKMILK